MSKKKKTAIAALIVLGIVAVGLAAGVYAKYIASFDRAGGAKIAKWDFSGENSEYEFKCDLTETYTNVRPAAENAPVIIAPGTAGACNVTLSNKKSDVAVDYTITLKESDGVPANLLLNGVSMNNFSAAGTLAIDANATPVNINWTWPYETDSNNDASDGISGDTADTTDGEAGKNMTLTFVVKGVQKQPQ